MALEHELESWKSRDILHNIELADGNPEAAAEARAQALKLFLAYRRDGGENHSRVGLLCHDVTAAMTNGSDDAPSINDVKLALDKLLSDGRGWDRIAP